MCKITIRLSAILLGCFFSTTLLAMQPGEIRNPEETLEVIGKFCKGFNQKHFDIPLRGGVKTLVVELKFNNTKVKWTDDEILSLAQLGDNSVGFVGTLDGTGYHVEAVQLNQKSRYSKLTRENLVNVKNNEADMPIVIHHFKEKTDYGIHYKMIENRHAIIDAVTTYIERHQSTQFIKNQEQFTLVLSQEGELSELRSTCLGERPQTSVRMHFSRPSDVDVKRSLQRIKQEFSKKLEFKLNGRKVRIEPQFHFMTKAEEAQYACGSFVGYDSAYNLQLLSNVEDDDGNKVFTDMGSTVGVAINSYVTEIYQIHKLALHPHHLNFGVYSDPAVQDRQMDELIDYLIEYEKPVVFMGAVGYTDVKEVSGKSGVFLDLLGDAEFIAKDVKNAAAAATAGLLQKKLKSALLRMQHKQAEQDKKPGKKTKIPTIPHAYIYKAPKDKKLKANWPRTVALEFQEFRDPSNPTGRLAEMVNFGGTSISLKDVRKKIVQEDINIIEQWEKYLKEQRASGKLSGIDTRIIAKLDSGLDKIINQDAILEYYETTSNAQLHPELEIALKIIKESLKWWLRQPHSQDPAMRAYIARQKTFPVVMIASGKLRDKYESLSGVSLEEGKQ